MKSELNQNISVSDHSVNDISKEEITDRRHKQVFTYACARSNKQNRLLHIDNH